MKVFSGVETLELKTVLANGPGVINPVMIWDEKDVLFIDAGLPGMGAEIKEAALSAGIPFERLNKILITHADMDHIGSLAQLISEAEKGITVMAHKEEKPYIECDLPPIRLKKMEESLASMTGPGKEQGEEMVKNLRKNYMLFRAEVNKCVEDGEVLPFCRGITCVYTPGHTPGHMSYYIEALKLLIAGDILQTGNGELRVCPDFTILNKEDNQNSLKKLSGYDIETVICYHGGLFHGDVSKRIAELAGI